MGNGEWGMGNGEWGMGNGEWGMGNGEWGMGNGRNPESLIDGKPLFPFTILPFTIPHFANHRPIASAFLIRARSSSSSSIWVLRAGSSSGCSNDT